MSDCDCPYCGAEHVVCDGPYGDDEQGYDYCKSCDKEFVVISSVHVTYTARCNDGDHNMKPSERHPGWSNCLRCGLFCQTGAQP